MGDIDEDEEVGLSAYDCILKALTSKGGKLHSKILRKRKKQLRQLARTETLDRKLDFDEPVEISDSEEKDQEVCEDSDDDEDDNDTINELEDNRHKGEFALDEDPFKIHFEKELVEQMLHMIKEDNVLQNEIKDDPSKLVISMKYQVIGLPTICSAVKGTLSSLRNLKVTKRLSERWDSLRDSQDGLMSNLQRDLFGYINSYQDLMFTQRSFQNGEDIRSLYCLHAVNHVLKTRSRILKNNEKIAQAQKEGKEAEEYRDHGFTRPKVLIVVPFRDACLRIVNQIIKLSLTMDGKGQVMQKKRFYDEYKDTTEDKRSKLSYVPEDFKAMFAGNIDDCFRIGITILRKAVRLYADFYSADIIIASPLGLRTIIGAEGESERDFDFLSSIEILILDQTDVFLMQNLEHVWHFLDHMHLQPKSARDTDFSRVRQWTLNGWSPYYRQTLLFSSFLTPEINHLFNKYCKNYAGKVKIQSKSCPGSSRQVVLQVPQIFHKIECDNHLEATERRFHFFTHKILPEFRSKLTDRIGIFVPSYFDFVRIRNFFKKNDISFLQISEYSKRENISRARTLFNEGKKQFLLFTERFYFFYRYRIKGMRHVIFYELPQYSQFYPEIINFLQEGNDAVAKAVGTSCTVLYSKYDRYKIEYVVGSADASKLLCAKKNVHMLVSEVF